MIILILKGSNSNEVKIKNKQMKKLFIISALLIASLNFAQFTVSKSDGTPINDGDVFIFGTTTYPDNSLEFVVTNPTNQDMDIVIYVESITNTDGSGFELCFGNCYSGVSPRSHYPSDSPYHLAANSSSEPHGNHFLNTATNGNLVLDYVLKFTQVDNAGHQIGTPVTITYRYDQTAAIKMDVLPGVKIFPTLVKNHLITVDSQQDLSFRIIDFLGKTNQKGWLTKGKHQLKLNNLKSGIYFLIMKNREDKKTFRKIIVQ